MPHSFTVKRIPRMYQKYSSVFVLVFCLFSAAAYSQELFSNCSAAFLDKKMIVDHYTDAGKCVVSATASGELTVCTAELGPDKSIPKDINAFKIAIRDKNTGTLVMYSGDTFRKIEIQKVLAQCRPGDRIVLLTLDREYALPHNEILVQ